MKLFSEVYCKPLLTLATIFCLSQAKAQEVVVVDSLVSAVRAGIENTLQGNVAGLRVKSWTGTAGIQSVMNLRALNLDPLNESNSPLILINGIPIVSSPSAVTSINPLSYYHPDQIERIEVIKSIDLLAAYGIQAPNGAINLVMKEGVSGPLHVRASASAGINYITEFDYRKDAFYGFNTIGRREVYGHGALVNEQSILVDGGGEYGSYLFGLNNHQDKGVINSTSFGRQSLFLNAKYNISPKLKAHFYNNLALAARDGRFAGEYNRDLDLPVVADETFYMDKKRNVAFLTSMGLSYEFNPDFSLHTLAGLSYEGSARDLYIPSNVMGGSIFSGSAAYKRQLININTYFKYHYSFSDDVKLDLRFGNEFRTIDNRLTRVDGSRSFESGGSDYVKVVTGYNPNQTDALSDHEIERLVGFYGTGKLSLKDRLDVNLVLRTDGSSLYGHKWGFYPAAGLSYKLTDDKLPLTLKAAIGKTGMLNRPEVYRGELIGKGEYFSGNELGVGRLYAPFADAGSIDVVQLDLGLKVDLTPSISLQADYFSKTYSDFIYTRFLSNIHGLDYQYESGGKINLSGVEFSLNGRWFESSDFSWSTGLNLSAYQNKVKELPADIAQTSLSQFAALGKGDAVTSFVAYESGREKIIGNSEPGLFGGLTNRLRYKAFTARFTMVFSSGSDILTESLGSRYPVSQAGGQYPLKGVETPYYWVEGEVPDQRYQGIRTIENGSFLRMATAEVGYHLGQLFDSSLSLTDLKLFLRGDNLFLLSKYSGVNPEENLTGVRKADLSLTGTPLPSSVVLGLKLVF